MNCLIVSGLLPDEKKRWKERRQQFKLLDDWEHTAKKKVREGKNDTPLLFFPETKPPPRPTPAYRQKLPGIVVVGPGLLSKIINTPTYHTSLHIIDRSEDRNFSRFFRRSCIAFRYHRSQHNWQFEAVLSSSGLVACVSIRSCCGLKEFV
jgi:hypothetical protein